MPSIFLTKGQVALVDALDYAALMALGRWCYSNSGYAVCYTHDEQGQRKTLYMHRVIMARMLGQPIPGGLQVDHIQHHLGRLDNRRSNLRLATRSQNQANKGRPVNNSSFYKGVSFNRGKWEARIRFGGQRLNLGRFEAALVAAQTYDAASRLLNGSYAGLNFPQAGTPPQIEAQVRVRLQQRGLNVSHLVLNERKSYF